VYTTVRYYEVSRRSLGCPDLSMSQTFPESTRLRGGQIDLCWRIMKRRPFVAPQTVAIETAWGGHYGQTAEEDRERSAWRIHNPSPLRSSPDSRPESWAGEARRFPLSGLEARFEVALQETAKPRRRLEW
jgi:hypothetical protein